MENLERGLDFVMIISSVVGFLIRVRKGLEAVRKWPGTFELQGV